MQIILFAYGVNFYEEIRNKKWRQDPFGESVMRL